MVQSPRANNEESTRRVSKTEHRLIVSGLLSYCMCDSRVQFARGMTSSYSIDSKLGILLNCEIPESL